MKPEQSEFVEESGRFWESQGMSRTAGRLLGWLMICEPPHQSAAELVSDLEISTGSVSTQVRVLEQVAMLERVTFRNDRATYYQLRDHVWARLMEGEVDRLQHLRKLAASASTCASDRALRASYRTRLWSQISSSTNGRTCCLGLPQQLGRPT